MKWVKLLVISLFLVNAFLYPMIINTNPSILFVLIFVILTATYVLLIYGFGYVQYISKKLFHLDDALSVTYGFIVVYFSILLVGNYSIGLGGPGYIYAILILLLSIGMFLFLERLKIKLKNDHLDDVFLILLLIAMAIVLYIVVTAGFIIHYIY